MLHNVREGRTWRMLRNENIQDNKMLVKSLFMAESSKYRKITRWDIHFISLIKYIGNKSPSPSLMTGN